MEIRVELNKVTSVSELAKQFKVNRSTIYQSIEGEGSRCIRIAIARLLNTKPSELWQDNERFSLILDDALYGVCVSGGVSLPV